MRCIAGAVLLFGAIAFTFLLADPWLVGTQWEDLGVVIALMAPFYVGIAVLAPLQEMATLSRQPLWQVAINALALVAIIVAMASFGALSPALLEVIGLISVLRMLMHAVFIWLHLGHVEDVPASGLAVGSAAR
ncbi:Membrane protein involved in the export of O-antigen and teichoic acid OS=Bosea thiooxidans OX=53254 GN=ARD30_16970 PE=4 SV=1 [Bosea thiooxidans]